MRYPHPADAPALSCGERTLTYGELSARADRVAAGLLASGLRTGGRVLALLPGGVEIYELLLGCSRAGLVLVPMNWRLAPDELRAVAADARAAALFGPADVPFDPPPLHVTDLAGWIAAAPASYDAERHDVLLQVYTSGTTGQPKGVLLTHANLDAKVPRAAASWDFTPDAVSLLATPLFHVGGLGWGLTGLHAGAHTIIAGSAKPASLVTLMREQRVTHTFLVPTILQGLCDVAGDAGFPDLRAIVFGAAPISAPTQRDVERTFQCRLIHVYGLSETTGAITQSSGDRLRSAGRAFPWVELSIRDPESGLPVATGVTGEVWTRSAQNTPGYAGNPAATAELLTADGWLRTGDAGHLDADGYLFLTDRLKNMIVTGGENVYPAEVEAVLREHPGVADVAVVGLPDDRWGETVAAVVVGTCTAAELIDYTAGRLAGYKRPRTVFFVEALPRNATGKVRRAALLKEVGV